MAQGDAEMRTAPASAARPTPPLKRVWRRIRQPLARSNFMKKTIVEAVHAAFRLVKATNRIVPGSSDLAKEFEAAGPCILALWHGQHLLAPLYKPPRLDAVAIVSRSADAELNAAVLAKAGIGVVRGSGGRDRLQSAGKGGAAALIALKRALDRGKTVIMIADIPHGVPRESGPGIIKLAQLSGRPILPLAFASSRRRIIEKSWDKTTISLPFGRIAIRVGEMIHVPDAIDEDGSALLRRRLDDSLNAATQLAYAMADGAA